MSSDSAYWNALPNDIRNFVLGPMLDVVTREQAGRLGYHRRGRLLLCCPLFFYLVPLLIMLMVPRPQMPPEYKANAFILDASLPPPFNSSRVVDDDAASPMTHEKVVKYMEAELIICVMIFLPLALKGVYDLLQRWRLWRLRHAAGTDLRIPRIQTEYKLMFPEEVVHLQHERDRIRDECDEAWEPAYACWACVAALATWAVWILSLLVVSWCMTDSPDYHGRPAWQCPQTRPFVPANDSAIIDWRGAWNLSACSDADLRADLSVQAADNSTLLFPDVWPCGLGLPPAVCSVIFSYNTINLILGSSFACIICLCTHFN